MDGMLGGNPSSRGRAFAQRVNHRPPAKLRKIPASPGPDTADPPPPARAHRAVPVVATLLVYWAFRRKKRQQESQIAFDLRPDVDCLARSGHLDGLADQHARSWCIRQQTQTVAHGSRRVSGTCAGQKFRPRATQAGPVPHRFLRIGSRVQDPVPTQSFQAVKRNGGQGAAGRPPISNLRIRSVPLPNLEDRSKVLEQLLLAALGLPGGFESGHRADLQRLPQHLAAAPQIAGRIPSSG